jgi:hypothetical protein
MRNTYFRISAIAAAAAVSCLLPSGTANGAPEVAAPESIVHQVPQVPLTINGEPVPASTITKYNGRPLYMVVVPDGSSHGHLDAYTEPADFERVVREQGGPEHATAKPERELAPETVSAPSSWIYSDDLTALFSLGTGMFTSRPDLTQVDMVCLPWCISWNDEASSATASDNGLLLFEHIHFTGSSLFIPPGRTELFLGSLGWDNRASSLQS